MNRRRSSVRVCQSDAKVRCEMFALWDFFCEVIARIGETMKNDPFKYD